MPLSFRLERVIEKIISVRLRGRKRALKKLAGVKMSASEAEHAWPRVLDHKWYLSERLGRDVGLRVAAADYFENISPPRPPTSYRANRDTLPPRLPMMMPLGKRA